jgi:signal transduction histidine kinase
VPDVATSPLNDRERLAYRATNVAAFMGVSLLKGGRWVLVFGVHSDVPRQWTPAEIALVDETAQRTWAAAERAIAELARQKSEAQFVEATAALREALLEATEAREQAERANMAKNEFLAVLGHELRSPLAAITLWTAVLRTASLPLADRMRALQAIADSADSQSRLVDDLMDLSRLARAASRAHRRGPPAARLGRGDQTNRRGATAHAARRPGPRARQRRARR